MSVGNDVGVFVLGSAVSLGSSAVLIGRLERLAGHLGFSDASLGLLAALAADAPEITSSVTAVVHHDHAVSIGVVLGSNAFNLAALLGLGAVVAGRVALHRRVVLLEGSVGVATTLLAVLVVTGALAPLVALVLVALALGGYVLVSSRASGALRRLGLPQRALAWLDAAVGEEEQEIASAVSHGPARASDALVALGCTLAVVLASVAMEETGTSLGRHFGLSSAVVGGLVLAAVTSLPNAVAAVYLARRGRGPAVLSEAMNSNTLNIAFGLVLPAAIAGLGTASGVSELVALFTGALTLAALGIAFGGRGIGRLGGATVISAYLVLVGLVAAR